MILLAQGLVFSVGDLQAATGLGGASNALLLITLGQWTPKPIPKVSPPSTLAAVRFAPVATTTASSATLPSSPTLQSQTNNVVAATASQITQASAAATQSSSSTWSGPSISGAFYLDSNWNGVNDKGEWSIQGITVRLTSQSDPSDIITTLTKADGSFYFGSLSSGSYSLSAVLPPKYYGVAAGLGTFLDEMGSPIPTGHGQGQIDPSWLGTINANNPNEIDGIYLPTADWFASNPEDANYSLAKYSFGEFSPIALPVSKGYYLSSTPTTVDAGNGTVPEPSALALVAVGGLVGGGMRRLRRKRSSMVRN
jgi:hypothetical protein